MGSWWVGRLTRRKEQYFRAKGLFICQILLTSAITIKYRLTLFCMGRTRGREPSAAEPDKSPQGRGQGSRGGRRARAAWRGARVGTRAWRGVGGFGGGFRGAWGRVGTRGGAGGCEGAARPRVGRERGGKGAAWGNHAWARTGGLRGGTQRRSPSRHPRLAPREGRQTFSPSEVAKAELGRQPRVAGLGRGDNFRATRGRRWGCVCGGAPVILGSPPEPRGPPCSLGLPERRAPFGCPIILFLVKNKTRFDFFNGFEQSFDFFFNIYFLAFLSLPPSPQVSGQAPLSQEARSRAKGEPGGSG